MHIASNPLRTVPIERARGLTPECFHEQYLSGNGKPVILTDALDSWPAKSKWSFDFFRARYGDDNVAPRVYSGERRLKLMKFSEFLDYVDNPGGPIPGLWVDPETLLPCPAPKEIGGLPFYLPWNVFPLHPELLEDVDLSPKFVEDWLPLLPPGLRESLDEGTRFFVSGLLIGCKDSQIGMHYDFLRTHAYLAQIVGTKRCTLFSPEDSAALYGGSVNPDAPDLAKFPLFRNATAYECTLAPGELLFIPCRWWHHVVSLDKTITVNYNFFNRVNFTGYLTRILRVLPEVVEGIENCPDARAALGIKWKSRGFDLPNSGKA
jgi:hypothetical protein